MVATHPIPPAALKPRWLAWDSTPLTVVPDFAFQELMKWPLLPTAMSISQAMMPSHTIAKATIMNRATTRTPRIIRPVNSTVSTVAMIIFSPLLGLVRYDECQPATYAAAGPMVPSMYVKLKATQVRKTNVSEKFAK